MVHTHGHHGQEQSSSHITGNDADDQHIAHAQLLHDPAQCGGEVTGSGHDDQDVGDQADDQGADGGEHDVQRIRHTLADPLFHLSQDPNAQHSSQNAAAASAQDGIQRHRLVEQAQDLCDLVDAVQAGDHAQHAAQDGGSAKPLSSTVASPCRQISQECRVDQAQQVIHHTPEGALCPVGHDLADQRGKACAQTGGHNAGDQRNKDIAKGLEHALDGALLLVGLDSSLVGLPVVGIVAAGRDAHVTADVCALAALAGAYHNFHLIGAVVDDAHHTLDALQSSLVDLGVLTDFQTQTGHAVGCGDDVVLTAYFFQYGTDQFFVRHVVFLLFLGFCLSGDRGTLLSPASFCGKLPQWT